MLLMLEDDADRVRRFRAVLGKVAPGLEVRLWRNAPLMIREAGPLLPRARLITLDHDLDPEEGGTEDPGTGWEAAQYLAAQVPACPVIIHTSNSERATWMMGEFDLGGWEYHRLPPWGDDWIEKAWRRLVRRLLT